MTKKIILALAFPAAVFFIAAAAIKILSVEAYTNLDASDRGKVAASLNLSAVNTSKINDGYIIQLDGNEMSVSRSGNEGELVLQAEIDAGGLRQSDRVLLENGIAAEDYEEVLKLLEDFSS